MIEYPLLGMELFIFVLFIIALTKILVLYHDNKNRLYITIIIYIIVVIGITIFNLITYFTDLSLDIAIVGELKIGILFVLIIFAIQVEFLLYLTKLKKLYVLLFIVNFYLIISLAIDQNMTVFTIYAIFVGVGLPWFLIYQGRKNRNGLAVGMGLFFFTWGLGQMLPYDIIFPILKILGTIFFFLGAQGFFDKYIVVDREEEKKIMDTWISKLVIKE